MIQFGRPYENGLELRVAEWLGADGNKVVRIGCDLVNDNGSFTLISGIFNIKPPLVGKAFDRSVDGFISKQVILVDA